MMISFAQSHEEMKSVQVTEREAEKKKKQEDKEASTAMWSGVSQDMVLSVLSVRHLQSYRKNELWPLFFLF